MMTLESTTVLVDVNLPAIVAPMIGSAARSGWIVAGRPP